jgi:hypothetical protein
MRTAATRNDRWSEMSVAGQLLSTINDPVIVVIAVIVGDRATDDEEKDFGQGGGDPPRLADIVDPRQVLQKAPKP